VVIFTCILFGRSDNEPMARPPSLLCVGCWQNLHVPVALRGVASIPFRLVGLKPSRMNPNTCTFCEVAFTKIMRARNVTIDATVFFADLRGYTSLTRSLPPQTMAALLDTFYDACGDAIWDHDGLLNKTIGDAVMAVFNFPIQHPDDHAEQAVQAARDLQASCRAKFAEFAATHGLDASDLGVGVGIDSGNVAFGEFGRTHRDLTAIGTVVNRAARAQAAAAPGQILVTKEVHDRTPGLSWPTAANDYQLKGFDSPISLYAA
jgi:adenylate cyclase